MNCPNCGIECITDKAGGWLCLKCQFRAPKNKGTITAMYAWVVVDKDGAEGIPAVQGPQGTLPLVTGDPKMAIMMKTAAHDIAKRTGMTVKFLRFGEREEI